MSRNLLEPDVRWENLRYVIPAVLHGGSHSVREVSEAGIELVHYSWEGTSESDLEQILMKADLPHSGKLARISLGLEKEWFSFNEVFAPVTRALRDASAFNIEHFPLYTALEQVFGSAYLSPREIMRTAQLRRERGTFSNLRFVGRELLTALMNRSLLRLANTLGRGRSLKNAAAAYEQVPRGAELLSRVVKYSVEVGTVGARITVTPDARISDVYWQDNLFDEMHAAQFGVIPCLFGLPRAHVEYRRVNGDVIYECEWRSETESKDEKIARLEWQVEKLNRALENEVTQRDEITRRRNEELNAFRDAFGPDPFTYVTTFALLELQAGNLEAARSGLNFVLQRAPLSAFAKEGLLRVHCYELDMSGETRGARLFGGVSTDRVWKLVPDDDSALHGVWHIKQFTDWTRGEVEIQELTHQRMVNERRSVRVNGHYALPPVPVTEMVGDPVRFSEGGERRVLNVTVDVPHPSFAELCETAYGSSGTSPNPLQDIVRSSRYRINEYRATRLIDSADLDGVPIVEVDFSKSLDRCLIENLDYFDIELTRDELNDLRFALGVVSRKLESVRRVKYDDWSHHNPRVNEETAEVHKTDFNKTNRLTHLLEDSRHCWSYDDLSSQEQRRLDIHYLLCVKRAEYAKLVESQTFKSDEEDLFGKLLDRVIETFERGGERADTSAAARLLLNVINASEFDSISADISSTDTLLVLREKRKRHLQTSSRGTPNRDVLDRLGLIDRMIADYEQGSLQYDTPEGRRIIESVLPEHEIKQILDHDAPYVEIYRSMKWFNHYLRRYLRDASAPVEQTRWLREVNFCLRKARDAIDRAKDYDLDGVSHHDSLDTIREAIDRIGEVSIDEIDGNLDVEKLYAPTIYERVEEIFRREISHLPPSKYLDPHSFRVRAWYLRFEPDATVAEQLGALLHDCDRITGEVQFTQEQFPVANYSSEEERYQAYKTATGQEGARNARRILNEAQVPEHVIEEVIYYVRHNDDKSGKAYEGIDKGTPWFENLLRLFACDAADFFETNRPIYVETHGARSERVVMKDKFMLEVVPDEYKTVITQLVA